jgi:hypothetical protein
MKTSLAILGIHTAISVALLAVMALDPGAAGLYSAIFFFLLNTPGVWVLKGLFAAPTLTAMEFPYIALLTLATTEAILGVATYLYVHAKRRLAPDSTMEKDTRNIDARP